MKMKKSLALFLALLMLLPLCACGASAKGGDSAAPQGVSMDMMAEAPAAAPEPVPVEDSVALSDAGLGGETAPAEPSAGDAGEVDPDKIIYSADVTVETTAFDEAVAGVADLIESYGGWIESSSVNDANYYSRARGYASSRSASYTLRVPSEKFAQLMSGLSDLGNVPYTHTYTENVTAQYYDVQARLTACRTQETRLLEMMEKAETVQELTYGQELARAFSRGFRNAGSFFKDLLVWLAGSVPTLLFLAALAAAAVVLVKKRRARRKAKKAPQPETEKKGE